MIFVCVVINGDGRTSFVEIDFEKRLQEWLNS